MNRSRPAIKVDLKSSEGRALVLQLCEDADAIFEGFRPSVMERLGLAPEDCMDRNERLVYGRMTGWGQEGLCESGLNTGSQTCSNLWLRCPSTTTYCAPDAWRSVYA